MRSTFESLQRLLPEQYEVSTLTAAELLDGSWTSKAALLVMPGGADLPYCNRLNSRGNTIIQGFVRSGGSYLGLCAGAYYACSRVQFEQGSRLQVVGDRELAFFPGIACGAAYPGFDYQTEAGAVAADVQFAVPPALAEQLQPYSSTLLQQDSHSSWCFTHDYSNGGPFFVTQDMQLDLSQLPGVQVLARYCALPDRHGFTFSRQQQVLQQQGELQPPPGVHHNGEAGAQAAAAVRCSVGSGVAVLCGTHPELEPRWLDVCGWSTERPRTGSHHSTPAEQAVPVASGGSSSTAAAAAAAGAGRSSSRTAQPALAVLEDAVAAGQIPLHALQPQQQHSPDAAVLAGSGASGADVGQGLMACEDVQLAQHTEALRRMLAASQEQRDLFLSCLLYEVLRRP